MRSCIDTLLPPEEGTYPSLNRIGKWLKQESVALVFQLRAIDRSCIQKRIGTVSKQMLKEMFEKLEKLTGRNR